MPAKVKTNATATAMAMAKDTPTALGIDIKIQQPTQYPNQCCELIQETIKNEDEEEKEEEKEKLIAFTDADFADCNIDSSWMLSVLHLYRIRFKVWFVRSVESTETETKNSHPTSLDLNLLNTRFERCVVDGS